MANVHQSPVAAKKFLVFVPDRQDSQKSADSVEDKTKPDKIRAKVWNIFNGPNLSSFCLFLFFSQCRDKYSTNVTVNDKSVDVVLGTRTPGDRIKIHF